MIKKQRLLIALSLVSSLLAGFSFEQRIARADEDAPPPAASPLPNLFTDTALPDLFTGSFHSSIPIQVPTGRAGMAPQLALHYSSSSGNGWVGMGWELEVGSIERSVRFGVDYNGDNYLLRLAGATVELVRISGSAPGDGTFAAKIEGSFNKIEKTGSSWNVTDKTGKQYLFGQTTASRQADPADSTRIFRWALDYVEDTHGNFITLSYTQDTSNGQIYLDHIDYAGNGALAPANTVKFYLESRPDAPAMDTTNFQVVTASRLKTVDVMANSSHVRTYKLSYTISASTGRSLLAVVQQFGADANVDGATGSITNESTASKLPAIGLTADNGTNGLQERTLSTTAPNWGTATWVGDYNGDGKMDIATTSGGTIWVKRSTLSNGESGFVEEVWPATGSNWGSTVWVGDFDGDGKTDIATASSGKIWVKRSTGSSFVEEEWFTGTTGLGGTVTWAGDFNGDGKMDLASSFISVHAPIRVFRSTGSSFVQETWLTSTSHWGSNSYTWVGDFNGDGNSDIATASGGAIWVMRSTGSSNGGAGFVEEPWTTAAVHLGASGFTWVGDFNGDGKMDIATSNTAGEIWVTVASIAERNGLAAGVANGVLYAVGGGSSGYLSTVESYNPAIDIWTGKTPMSTKRYAPAVGVVNGTLYAVGGDTTTGLTKTVEAYDPANDRWTTMAPMSTARAGLAVGVVSGTLYAVGGYGSNGIPLSTVEAYDPTNDRWTTMAPMSTARAGLAVGVVNGTLYAVGGYGSNGIPLSTVEAYDPANDRWTMMAPMSTPRAGLAVGVVNGILYTVGGYGSNGMPLNTVEAYDPATDSWSPKANMSTARGGLAAGVVNGILYAVGGNNSSSTTTMEAYDPATPSGTIWVKRSTGSSFVEELWTSTAPNWGLSGFTWAGDFNGDGKTDIATVTGSNSSSTIWVKLSNEFSVDLLSNLSNGLGGSTAITYVPSTQYTNTQLPFPVQTVSAITANDGNGNISTSSYTYAGGFYYPPERDFRGFNYGMAADPNGPSKEHRVTETWFHQGNDTRVNDNNPNVPAGYMQGKPYSVRISDESDKTYSLMTTSYADDSVAPYFTPPLQVDGYNYDGDSTYKQTRTVFTYETTYGNLTRMNQYGDLSDSTDDHTMVRAYSPNSTAWIVGLPTTETIYQGISTAPTDQVAQTTYYYDDLTSCAATQTGNQTPTQGNLTRIVRWLSGGTSPETRMAYDAYGNLVCTRDANGHQTTIAYDSSSTFPKVVTTPLIPPTTTQYYGVDSVPANNGLYGQPQSVTDPNGNAATMTYDSLGRKISIAFPDNSWTSFSYNNFGTVGSQNVQTNTAAGLSSWTYFDGLGRTIIGKKTGTDSKVTAIKTQYNHTGTVAQQSLTYFDGFDTPKWRTFTYDPMGRVVRVDNPDSTWTLGCYDAGVTVSIDADKHRKRETRDASGRLIKVEEYTGTNSTCTTAAGSPSATTTYQYDVLGNPRFVTDANGNKSEMRYDTLGRKIFMHDPDMGYWTYGYDGVGNLIRQTDGDGQIFAFTYDALNRLTTKSTTNQDAAPPSAPSNLVATVASDSQLDLTWTASTDDVGVAEYQIERCQGSSCSNFLRIATAAGTTYSDTGLSIGVNFRYRVRAIDLASKPSGYSNTADAITPDTTPPTAPSNLIATASGSTQINLAWTASTDNGKVTGYQVERCQGAGCSNYSQIATPTTNSYNNSGLNDGTRYSYRVRAVDAVGNPSAYSNIASAVTADTNPPTAPSNLTATAFGNSQINLVWTASTDNGGVTDYLVERCPAASCRFSQIAMPTTASFSDTSVSGATSYSYRVRAEDAAGHRSAYSNIASVTTLSIPAGIPLAVAAGTDHACALLSAGGVICWGSNAYGQLGNNSTVSATSPVTVSYLSTVASITAGQNFSCAVLADRSIRCWGDGAAYRIGNGLTSKALTPAGGTGITTAIAVTAGSNFACALLDSGAVKCWGANTYGQLGNNSTTTSKSPVPVSGIDGINSHAIAIAAGTSFTCALLSDGTVKCWGYNTYGQLGNGTTNTAKTPVLIHAITPATPAVAITAGASHACAVLNNGTVMCWGFNSSGQLGNNLTATAKTPVHVIGIDGINASAIAIAGGTNHTCAILTNRTVRCWGANTNGQLGDGTTVAKHLPVPVTGLTGATAVSAGKNFSCAVSSDHMVQCWGYNNIGQLGNGTMTQTLTPSLVNGFTQQIAISGVAAGSITKLSATITWTTNEPADSQVDFGTSAAYGSSATDNGLVTSHSVALSGLTAATLYHYRVKSHDVSGNAAVSEDYTMATTGADLLMSAVSTTVAAPVTPGKTLTVSYTVLNQGAAAAGRFTVGFHFSPNTVAGDGDDVAAVTTRAVASLAAGASKTATTTVTVPSTLPVGTYNVCAIADPANTMSEADETNNGLCTTTQIAVGLPDMVMTVVTPNAATVNQGATLTVTDRIRNQGLIAQTGKAKISYRLSLNQIYGDSDDVAMTAARSVTALAPGASKTATTTLTITATTPPNTYYLCAMADSANGVVESDESNNTLCSITTVTVPYPDLVISAISTAATSVIKGKTFSLSNSVLNRGGSKTSTAFTITFHLSTNTTYGDGDDVAMTATRSVASLAIGAASTGSTTLTVPATASSGTYFVCAMADGGNTIVESIESNNTNCSSTKITVP